MHTEDLKDNPILKLCYDKCMLAKVFSSEAIVDFYGDKAPFLIYSFIND